MTGLTIAEAVFAGVALACMISMLYHLIRKTDKKIDYCAEKADKKMDDHFSRTDKKMDDHFSRTDKKMEHLFGQADKKMDDLFSRTDKKMEHLFGQADKKMDDLFGRTDKKLDNFIEKTDKNFDAIAVRLAGHDEQLSRQDERLAAQGEQLALNGKMLYSHGERLVAVETRLVAVETEVKDFRGEFAAFRTETNKRFDKVDTGFAEIREMFFRFYVPGQPTATSPASQGFDIEESKDVQEPGPRGLGDQSALSRKLALTPAAAGDALTPDAPQRVTDPDPTGELKPNPPQLLSETAISTFPR